ncbi:MAG: sigma-54-dependent Fis family transcriptional regulator [Bacteroidia bacterium]|nr:sigma-54-dependent Fis family transcriptional regulator [Bacteroidia bacterium]
MVDIQSIKQKFGIIGNDEMLNRAIDTARQVAPTDLTVLISGESGVGKEAFPQIIHSLSARKHGSYIAVNCGAIPEGTIDSELFGHEKGSFTGAHEARKGYFEVANNGTIFLDEVAELPVSTQVRLLRVLESGEFMRVGSSKVIKTDVRVVAATNVDIPEAIKKGKFRQDLFYRLNTVPIIIPPLRERKEDIYMLFRKFSSDFAAKYHMPILQLDQEARRMLEDFRWDGNIRQLKNITEQISIIEKDRMITPDTLRRYLPRAGAPNLPVLYSGDEKSGIEFTERELLYKVLFEMRRDISELKRILSEVIDENQHPSENLQKSQKKFLSDFDEDQLFEADHTFEISTNRHKKAEQEDYEGAEILEESLSLTKREEDLIRKALEKHHGKRKAAAEELGISERTLYRKIKEYNI